MNVVVQDPDKGWILIGPTPRTELTPKLMAQAYCHGKGIHSVEYVVVNDDHDVIHTGMALINYLNQKVEISDVR